MPPTVKNDRPGDPTQKQLLTHSEAGVASCLVGVMMLLVQACVFMAVAGGVKDNQGTIYAFTVPFFTYLIGVPLGLALALLGFLQQGRKRLFANLGVCLTLAGPLVFVLDTYGRMPPRWGTKVFSFENTDGAGTFGSQLVVIASTLEDYRPHPADMDGDNDVDLLSVFGNKISWFENTDGAGTLGPQRVIATTAPFTQPLYAADIDGDGDMDVLSASPRENMISWFENTDGRGTFGPRRFVTTSLTQTGDVYASDLDGDGDSDIVCIAKDVSTITSFLNTDGAGTFGPPRVIAVLADGARSVFPADLNGDGSTDVLVRTHHDIYWCEITDGTGTLGPRRVIMSGTDSARQRSVHAADLDGDGDLDVLSAASYYHSTGIEISWHENIDAAGTFGPPREVRSYFMNIQSVSIADVDGDDDLDILCVSSFDVVES